MTFYTELGKKNLEIHLQVQDPQIAKAIFSRKNRVGNIAVTAAELQNRLIHHAKEWMTRTWISVQWEHYSNMVGAGRSQVK